MKSFSAVCLIFCLAFALQTCLSDDVKAASTQPQEESAQTNEEGWIRTWLIGGPFGYAGVAPIAPYYEQYMLPISGQEWNQNWLDSTIRVKWKEYASPEDKIDFNTAETFQGRPNFSWPLGRPGSAYANLYLKFPFQTDLILEFQSSLRAEVFLNDKPLLPNQKSPQSPDTNTGYARKSELSWRIPVTIPSGVSRLLVKLYFPQQSLLLPKNGANKMPVWFKCRLLTLEGQPITAATIGSTYAQANVSGRIEYYVDPPNYYFNSDSQKNVRGRRLGDLVRLKFNDTAHPWQIFTPSENVELYGMLSIMTPAERMAEYGLDETAYDKDEQKLTINSICYDFNGKVIWRDTQELKVSAGKPAKVCMELGKLPRGHYTVYTQIMHGMKFVAQPWPVMVTVVPRPDLPAKGVQSKFAHSFYYILEGTPEDDERAIFLLTMAKTRQSIGSAFKWWMTENPVQWISLPPKDRTLPRTPRLASLAKAKKLGLEFTGNVGAYYQRSTKCPQFSSLNPEHVIVNQDYDGGLIDSDEFEKLVDTAVYETVSRNKNNFHFWRMDNEMNLLGWAPEEYVQLHRLTSKALKRADPTAKLWSGSISAFSPTYVDQLLCLGIDKYIDIYDYHYYIWPQADITYSNMGGLPELLEVFDKYNVKTPMALGEFGCYRSIYLDSARTQAIMFVRALVAAHTYDRLKYIAPHFGFHPNDWSTGAEVYSRGQYPSYLAYRTCADFIEGAKPQGTINLGKDVAAYRFVNPAGKQVVVLWAASTREVDAGWLGEKWKLYDMLGAPLKHPDTAKITVGIYPIFCIGE